MNARINILAFVGMVGTGALAVCSNQGESTDSSYGQCDGSHAGSCSYIEATLPIFCLWADLIA